MRFLSAAWKLRVVSLRSENHSTGVLLRDVIQGKELIYIRILTNYVFTRFIFLGFKYFSIEKKKNNF